MTNLLVDIPPGLFSNDTPFSGAPRWVVANGVRFWQGAPQTIGGWQRRIATQMASKCTMILEWKINDGTAHVAYGGLSHLYVEKAATLFNISPASIGSTCQWNFDNYGETLIVNISGAKVYQWSLNTGVVAAQVTNAPVAVTTILVTAERQLLAFGCNEEVSGTFNPRCIRGSDIEDITDWTTTAANNAFEHILDGATSGIVAAAKVGDYLGVWTSTELFIGQFLGDPGQTYSFKKVAGQCGIVGRRAVTVIDGRAYWLTPDLLFRSWAPGELPTILPCPIIDTFRGLFSGLSAAERTDTVACHVAAYGEVWFHYGGAPLGIFTAFYAAFSLIDGTWFNGSTQRRHMHQGLSNVIAVDNGGNLLNCETGQYGDSLSEGQFSWSLETSDFYLDDAGYRMMCRGAEPDFKTQAGNVTMTLLTRDKPRGSETQSAAQTFTTGTTRKDFRVSGRMGRIQLTGTDNGNNTDTFMRLGKPLLDLVRVGKR